MVGLKHQIFELSHSLVCAENKHVFMPEARITAFGSTIPKFSPNMPQGSRLYVKIQEHLLVQTVWKMRPRVTL